MTIVPAPPAPHSAPQRGFEMSGKFRVTPATTHEGERLQANISRDAWEYSGTVKSARVAVGVMGLTIEVYLFDFEGVESAVRAHMIEIKAAQWGLDRPTAMIRLGLLPVAIPISQVVIERIGEIDEDEG